MDNIDQDGDGVNRCFRAGVKNELLVTGLHGGDAITSGSEITVLEYRNGAYEEAWSEGLSAATYTTGGAEVGDLTGDGIPEIALTRAYGKNGNPPSYIEVWTYDGSNDWSQLWRSVTTCINDVFYVGDISDVDGDGMKQLLVTNGGNERLELYSWNGQGFSVEATVRDCAPNDAHFIATAGDLNGNGLPEILFQCHSNPTPGNLVIQEYAGGSYPVIATVQPPPGYTIPMIIDDMETGDVNRDGRADAVFCGNSGQGHVLTYRNGTYVIEYTTPKPAEVNSYPYFSQTCSIGEMTNDGHDDFLVVHKEGAKVYSHDGSGYQEVWVGAEPTKMPGIGASFAGDSDNDGYTEFLFTASRNELPSVVRLYENDVAGATSFTNTTTFDGLGRLSSAIVIANLNPFNDEDAPADCDDNDPGVGAGQFCGDDAARPAAGSVTGYGGVRWSDTFTLQNTSGEEREVKFTFTQRGEPGQPVATRTERIPAGRSVTYDDPGWFAGAGALLLDVMDGPATDILSSGTFKGRLPDGTEIGQDFETLLLEAAVTGDAYILTTPDPEQERINAAFQAARDTTSLELTLENPIGTVHWRKELPQAWHASENQLFSKVEEHATGVPNLVLHYSIDGAAHPVGSVVDNESGDATTRMPATPATALVMPVIGQNTGVGVAWRSQFLMANMAQERNEVELRLYTGSGGPLSATIPLGRGKSVGYENLLSQVSWRDQAGSPVTLDEAVGCLEIRVQHNIIAGGRFYSVDPAGRRKGQGMRAFASPNIEAGEEYLFLGVQNEDATGVVRARLGFTNLTEQESLLEIDVLRQDGTVAGSFERAAAPMRFSDWRIPTGITEEGELYTLSVRSSQPGYAYLSQINRSNDGSTNYPLER